MDIFKEFEESIPESPENIMFEGLKETTNKIAREICPPNLLIESKLFCNFCRAYMLPYQFNEYSTSFCCEICKSIKTLES